MKREIPRNAEGNRVCEFCLDREVPASLGTKPKRYCSRNCRQRAYEARKTGNAIRQAVARGVELGRRTSRDDADGTSRDDSGTSRDVPSVQVNPPVPNPGPVSAGTEPPPVSKAPAPLPPRRAPGRRRVGMTADAMPLWSPEQNGDDDQA